MSLLGRKMHAVVVVCFNFPSSPEDFHPCLLGGGGFSRCTQMFVGWNRFLLELFGAFCHLSFFPDSLNSTAARFLSHLQQTALPFGNVEVLRWCCGNTRGEEQRLLLPSTHRKDEQKTSRGSMCCPAGTCECCVTF